MFRSSLLPSGGKEFIAGRSLLAGGRRVMLFILILIVMVIIALGASRILKEEENYGLGGLLVTCGIGLIVASFFSHRSLGWSLREWGIVSFWVGIFLALIDVTTWLRDWNRRRSLHGPPLVTVTSEPSSGAPLRVGAIAAVLVALVVAGIIYAIFFRGGGDGNNVVAEVPPTTIGELNLDRVVIKQSGQEHTLPAGLLHDQIPDFVLEPGLVGMTLTFKSDKDFEGRVVTLVDSTTNASEPQSLSKDGEVNFLLNLTLSDKAWRLNPFKLVVDSQERNFELLAMQPISAGGMTAGNMVNTPDEAGAPANPSQPQTAEVSIDPTFVKAFGEFCGFSSDQIKKVSLEPNDRPRFQVAWTGTAFVQSQHQIAVGQPIWVATSKSGDRCYVNPPCGNPEVVPGKLPIAPPELQPVPTPTPRKEVPSATPSASVTPAPSATRTPVPSSTPVLPTATPAPTQTAEATPTKVPACCQTPPPLPVPTFGFTPVPPLRTPTDPTVAPPVATVTPPTLDPTVGPTPVGW